MSEASCSASTYPIAASRNGASFALSLSRRKLEVGGGDEADEKDPGEFDTDICVSYADFLAQSLRPRLVRSQQIRGSSSIVNALVS